MSKLFSLIGDLKYDKLKAAMGDAFEKFEESFENDSIKEGDVTAKLEEFGITDEETKEDVEENKEGTEETGGGEEGNKEDVEETGGGEEGIAVPNLEGILEDGWNLDNKIDLDKILYKPLRDIISGLQEIAMNADWYAKYKIAILSEALQQGMHDSDDANRFISIDDMSMDADGNVIGVKEAFDKLKKDKPHLFKQEESKITNPLDVGFNPVDKKVTAKAKSYAEAIEQTRALSGK